MEASESKYCVSVYKKIVSSFSYYFFVSDLQRSSEVEYISEVYGNTDKDVRSEAKRIANLYGIYHQRLYLECQFTGKRWTVNC